LVGYGDKLLGQFPEVLIVGDQRLELLGLLGGDAFGELLALDIALQDIIRALPGLGASARLLEELAAEAAATKAIDALDLLKDLFPALFELSERSWHGRIVSIQIQYASRKDAQKQLLFTLGDYFVSHPGSR
jgi:hypothetical protein